ncbi:MAG: MBL fold metallo-hydrolase, partial [Deltaproteobacteria bacterium]
MKVKQIIVGSMGVCCYILGCEKTGLGIVIDPGGSEDEILPELDGLNIKYIVATHGHADHVCGMAALRKKTSGRTVMHLADDEFFSQSQVRQFFSHLGLDHAPPADIKVQDGDILEAGGVRLTVLHTPGHTPGGICLYSAPHLFTGDTLFAGGVGRTDLPGGSHQQLFQS